MGHGFSQLQCYDHDWHTHIPNAVDVEAVHRHKPNTKLIIKKSYVRLRRIIKYNKMREENDDVEESKDDDDDNNNDDDL